jgi:hypothetical protein
MGAKATCFDAEGYTPFHKAVLNGHVPLIQLLFDEGADVNAKSLNNTTPLQLAFRSNHIFFDPPSPLPLRPRLIDWNLNTAHFPAKVKSHLFLFACLIVTIFFIFNFISFDYAYDLA